MSSLRISPLVLLSISDHSTSLSSNSCPYSGPCLGLLFGPSPSSATDCLPFDLHDDHIEDNVKEYYDLHKGVFPNATVTGIYVVEAAKGKHNSDDGGDDDCSSNDVNDVMKIAFTKISLVFPSCLTILKLNPANGSYTCHTPSTSLTHGLTFPLCPSDVEISVSERTVIERVTGGEIGGRDHVRDALDVMEGKVEGMLRYLKGGGRDYDIVRKVNSVVRGMEGGRRKDAIGMEKFVLNEVWDVADLARGCERRRERTGGM